MMQKLILHYLLDYSTAPNEWQIQLSNSFHSPSPIILYTIDVTITSFSIYLTFILECIQLQCQIPV